MFADGCERLIERETRLEVGEVRPLDKRVVTWMRFRDLWLLLKKEIPSVLFQPRAAWLAFTSLLKQDSKELRVVLILQGYDLPLSMIGKKDFLCPALGHPFFLSLNIIDNRSARELLNPERATSQTEGQLLLRRSFGRLSASHGAQPFMHHGLFERRFSSSDHVKPKKGCFLFASAL